MASERGGMMDDLIRRSTLIKSMENKYQVADKTGLNAVGLDCGFIITERIINEQPTAYDVEAVLNELENMRAKPAELVYDVPLIENIIEIVKKGGVK